MKRAVGRIFGAGCGCLFIAWHNFVARPSIQQYSTLTTHVHICIYVCMSKYQQQRRSPSFNLFEETLCKQHRPFTQTNNLLLCTTLRLNTHAHDRSIPIQPSVSKTHSHICTLFAPQLAHHHNTGRSRF